jgi:hypothetical protein
MGGIGGLDNATNTWNNEGRGWAVVRAGGIGFAVGATGRLLQDGLAIGGGSEQPAGFRP